MDKLKIANHLKLVLPAEDFILTGSYALQKMGFDTKSKDLDIILVNPPQSTLDVLETLQNSNPPKNLLNCSYNSNSNKLFRFVHDGVGVDVFIYTNTVITEIQTQCGLKLASLNHIITAKKSMGRPKDMLQLVKLKRDIITDGEFNNYITAL